MSELAETLYSTPEMAAVWSDGAFVRGMLAFEAALARAEAHAGVIPLAAAEAIGAACAGASGAHGGGEPFDAAAILRAAAHAGSPAIPLVQALTARIAEPARGYVHWGATSQDAIDTALVLQMRRGLDLLRDGLLTLGASCAALADAHRQTVLAGRTLLQQAVPIPFGLKAARWLALVTRQAERVASLRARISVVQLGGAAGTLAALGTAGPRVTALLAAELGLTVPDLPWHAERDRVAEVAAGLGIVAGAMAKIAGDLVLLAQTEVGEVVEAAAEGKGGSSAMPQKRNPADAIAARAAAALALGVVPVLLDAQAAQEHERAAGAWQAEWAALPDLFRYTAGAVARTGTAVAGMTIDADRMRTNLMRAGGLSLAEALSMALAPYLGRDEAQRVVRDVAGRVAASSGDSLEQAARADARIRAHLTDAQIAAALDPLAYLGSSDTYIDRALDGFRALQTNNEAT